MSYKVDSSFSWTNHPNGSCPQCSGATFVIDNITSKGIHSVTCSQCGNVFSAKFIEEVEVAEEKERQDIPVYHKLHYWKEEPQHRTIYYRLMTSDTKIEIGRIVQFAQDLYYGYIFDRSNNYQFKVGEYRSKVDAQNALLIAIHVAFNLGWAR